MKRTDLPFVRINCAITADGKLAPDTRRFVPFSSPRDQELMMELRSEADAVLSGARTVDLGEVDLGPGGRKYQRKRVERGLSEFNLRVIASGSGSVNPRAHIFKTRFSPILLLTTAAAPPRKLQKLRNLVDDVFPSRGATLDFEPALRWLRAKWGVRHLLCEGGGEINAGLLRAGLVHEICVTLCPVLFGGRSAPTLADGPGITELADVNRLKLLKSEERDSELFCTYKVLPPDK